MSRETESDYKERIYERQQVKNEEEGSGKV